ncbi:PQQ-like beta-propeller repeat protein [Streptomyces sp. NBC_00322]|uniref:PQQ-like beta-propeller repeat protein n=1 Tax=Streptomyces sp. NBC_00322 TaxID=2975712 RepID=UPI002E291001|nr:PQQ-binding-like beta-propeller repeat protein [Streptomyces sp. NBC_00322]
MNATGDVPGISRRTVLRGSLGVLGLAGAAGLAGACTAEEEDGPKKRDAAWTFDGSVYGELTVDGGTVYVPTVGPDLLYALDARTGDTRWSAKGGTSTGTEPDMVAVLDGTVFRVSQDGLVHAYRASDGKRLWRAGPLAEEGEPDRPFVLGSVLCVQLRARSDEDGRVLEPGVLCGIDTASGRVLWRTDMSWLFTPDPKRGVLFRSTPDGVAACDPATGRERWRLPGARGAEAPAFALGPDTVHLVSGPKGNTHLYAYDAAGGAPRWDVPALDGTITAAPDGRALYLHDGRGRLHAHSAADGRRTWTATTAPYARDEVVPYGGTILLSSGDSYHGEDGRQLGDDRPGYVLAHSARTGKALWRQDREQPSWTLPVPSGRLALVGHDTAWWAYDIATGEPRWRLACDGALADDPVVRDGMLYGPNTEGVRAVRL